LQLEVELVGENPPRLEALLDQVLQALDHALGLRLRRLAEVPIDAQLPAERRVFLRGATLAAVSPDWRSQTSSSGSAPSDAKISAPAPARE
jgi:hypothetical protein